MKLFCSADHGPRPGQVETHDFTPGEVEKIIYVLQAMYADAVCSPDDGEQELRGTDAYTMQQPCLVDLLNNYASDIEIYAEWVSENVEARKAAQ